MSCKTVTLFFSHFHAHNSLALKTLNIRNNNQVGIVLDRFKTQLITKEDVTFLAARVPLKTLVGFAGSDGGCSGSFEGTEALVAGVAIEGFSFFIAGSGEAAGCNKEGTALYVKREL